MNDKTVQLIISLEDGRAPNKEIRDFLSGYADFTSKMTGKLGRLGNLAQIYTSGGGRFSNQDLATNSVHLLGSLSAKFAKDALSADEITNAEEYKEILEKTSIIIQDWYSRGYLKPVDYMKDKSKFSEYLRYTPNNTETLEDYIQNRLKILGVKNLKALDLGKNRVILRKKWHKDIPDEGERINQLVNGENDPRITAFIDLIGYIVLKDVSIQYQLLKERIFVERTNKIRQILTYELLGLILKEPELVMRNPFNNPHILSLIVQVNAVINMWYMSGLLMPADNTQGLPIDFDKIDEEDKRYD